VKAVAKPVVRKAPAKPVAKTAALKAVPSVTPADVLKNIAKSHG
jgi:hypothetical protein